MFSSVIMTISTSTTPTTSDSTSSNISTIIFSLVTLVKTRQLISDFHSAYSDKPFVQSYTCSVIASYYVQESKIYCDTINLHFHFPLTSSVSIEPAFCIDSISSNSSNSSISDNSDNSSALYSPSMPRWMSSVSFLINSIRSNLFMVFSSALFSVTSAFSDCTCCPLALTILILLEIR